MEGARTGQKLISYGRIPSRRSTLVSRTSDDCLSMSIQTVSSATSTFCVIFLGAKVHSSMAACSRKGCERVELPRATL